MFKQGMKCVTFACFDDIVMHNGCCDAEVATGYIDVAAFRDLILLLLLVVAML